MMKTTLSSPGLDFPNQGSPVSIDWCDNYGAGLAALQRCEHDICLLDYRLGERTGLDLLRKRSCLAAGPVIFLTARPIMR